MTAGSMQIFAACFILAPFLSFTVHAFLPRINSAKQKSETKDHILITRNGLIKTVIHFFFDNSQYLKNESLTGFLQGVLSEIGEEPTAGKDAMNTISSQIKFINAINAIQSANAVVDSFNRKAEEHFDGEQFQQGAKRLIRLRQELITSLLKGDKLKHARNLAGSALHTLQDFYSRSNWIELGNSVPFDVLGQPGNEISEIFVAGPNEATCTSCLSDQDRNDKCGTNLITGKLTSGYRSGQDVRKPVNKGKCSHGGGTDDSRFQSATGGINKDSTSIKESPHARYETFDKEKNAMYKQFRAVILVARSHKIMHSAKVKIVVV